MPLAQRKGETTPEPARSTPSSSSNLRPPPASSTLEDLLWDPLPTCHARHTWERTGKTKVHEANDFLRSATPSLSWLKSVLEVFSYLPQVFALLTAAESQSLVCARRSIGGL